MKEAESYRKVGPAGNQNLIDTSLCVTGGALLVLAYLRFRSGEYLSPDSWSYYELSRSIGHDFYHINTLRQYWIKTSYGIAFPPGWPLMIAAAGWIFGNGPDRQIALSLALFFFFSILAEIIGRKFLKLRYVGLLTFALISSDPDFREEVLSGRAGAAACVLALLAMAAFVQVDRGALKWPATLGVIMGMSVLVRMDALIPAVLLGILLGMRGAGLRCVLVYIVLFLVTMSPWIFYSLFHFHTFFVTENRFVAVAVDRTIYSTTWIPPGQLITLWQNPLAWAAKLMRNFYVVFNIVGTFAFQTPAAAVVMLGLVWGVLCRRRVILQRLRLGIGDDRHDSCQAAVRMLEFATLQFLGFVPGILLTGYRDVRYLLPFIVCAIPAGATWLLAGPAACAVTSGRRTLGACLSRKKETFFAVAAVILVILAAAPLIRATKSYSLNRPFQQAGAATPFQKELRCLRADKSTRRVLVIGNATLATEFGAMTGWPTALEPLNFITAVAEGSLDPKLANAFRREFDLGSVMLAEPGMAAAASKYAKLEAIPGCSALVFIARSLREP